MSQNNQTSYFIINILPFSNQTAELQWILTELFFQVGDLDTTPIPIKMSVRGCPIYFQMIGPQPDNQNQGPIIRSVYYRMLKMLQFTCKDCSLIFMIDRFGSHVSGGDTVSRSLRLINTSPYGEPFTTSSSNVHSSSLQKYIHHVVFWNLSDIRMDWVTYNLEVGDSKLIDLLVACGEPFPLKDADGNEVLGGLDSSVMFPPTWDDSHTPSREGTSSTFMTKSVSLSLVFIVTSQNM